MTRRTATLVLFPLLTACAPQDDAFPTADAGRSVNGEVGQESIFDGSASYGEALTFAWSLSAVPEGSNLTSSDLLEAHSPWPGLRPDVEGLYVMDLEVCDPQGNCDWSQTEALVGQDAQSPRATQKPTLNGGGFLGLWDPNNEAPVPIGTIFRGPLGDYHAYLNADESYDPEGEDLEIRWTFVSVPSESMLTNADIQNARASAASFLPDVKGTYKVRLTVGDGKKWGSKQLPGFIFRALHDPDPVD